MNLLRLLILSIVVTLSVIGCTGYNHSYIVNNEGSLRPKKYKFKVNPLLNDSSIIEGGYLEKLCQYLDEGCSYSYYRFFKNGKVLYHSGQTKPTIEDYNDINKGNIGYYEIKDSILRI
jgi:hypothetical protein